MQGNAESARCEFRFLLIRPSPKMTSGPVPWPSWCRVLDLYKESTRSISCCLVCMMINIVTLTGSRVTAVIELTRVRRSTHCGWCHSRDWSPRRWREMKEEASGAPASISASWLWMQCEPLTSQHRAFPSTHKLWPKTNPFSFKLLLSQLWEKWYSLENCSVKMKQNHQGGEV